MLWVIFLGVYLTRPIADPDVWWHINVGKWILAHHTVPSKDLWTVYGNGEIFRAYSWIQEILYALAYHLSGDLGLSVLYALTSIFIAISLSYSFGIVAKDFLVGLLLGTICMMSLVSHLSLRPQSITWGLFALLILAATKIQQREKGGGLLLFIASVVWANTHLSLMLGMVGVFLWLAPSKGDALRAVIIVFLGSLITPYLGGEWMTFYEKIGHPVLFSNVAEFAPVAMLSYPLAFLVILWALLFTTMRETRYRMRFFQWCFLLGFTVLGVSIVKFLPFSIIASSFVIADVVAKKTLQGRFTEGMNKLVNLIHTKLIGQGLYVLIIAMIVVHTMRIQALPVDLKLIPDRSMNFFIEKGLPHPLLNSFKDGGYVSFRLSDGQGIPKERVSIDGRTNLIPKDLWEDYLVALKGSEGYERYIERFHPETILWKKELPLTQHLLASGSWCEAFAEGDEYVLLVKNTASNQASWCNLKTNNRS